MFSSKSFIVLFLTCRFMINLELMFAFSIYNTSFFFACWYLVVQAAFVEKIILSPLNYFGTLVENQLTINTWAYFWTQFYSIHLHVCLYTGTTQFLCYETYWSFVLSVLNQEVQAFQISSSFWRLFWLFWFLYISVWILSWVWKFLKSGSWDFDRNCIESVDQFGGAL